MSSQATKASSIPHKSLTEFSFLQSQIEETIYLDCLQRFARRISHLYDLETQGEITPAKALEGIRLSLEMLDRTKQDLSTSKKSML
ncbi:hypothetical protein [Synechococcus sp. PCC 7336]|uniref:DUF7219 family protein n=1 Tax=Synechococcus sp. PCC 7336 TaxID=195250 RepID=UPI0012E9B3E7|nr:hypothetical protein [Synechococcus sp. PCC 7336]